MKNSLKVLRFSFVDSLKTIFTDFGAILVLVIAAIAYPVVYSISYSKQVVTELDAVVIDHDQSAMSRKWINMLNATPGIKVSAHSNSLNEAEQLFWENKVHAIVSVPEGFEKNVFKKQQNAISMYADASNFLYYKETYKAVMRAVNTFAAGIELKQHLARGASEEQAMERLAPLNIKLVNLYNPAGSYGSFVMPGIMLIIIQQTLLIGIGLIGGAGRERKRMLLLDNKLALSDHPFAVISGKALAYFLIGVVNMIFSSVVVYHWFSYPDKSSILPVVALSIPFLFSVVFMGLAVSLLFKHREHSIMFLVFLTPIILFVSGLSWPVESMPGILHQIFRIFPATQMVPAYIRVRTMGVSLPDIQYEILFLWGQAFVFFLLAVFGFKIAMNRLNRK